MTALRRQPGDQGCRKIALTLPSAKWSNGGARRQRSIRSGNGRYLGAVAGSTSGPLRPAPLRRQLHWEADELEDRTIGISGLEGRAEKRSARDVNILSQSRTRSARMRHNLRSATTARSMRRTLYCDGVDRRADRCSKTMGLHCVQLRVPKLKWPRLPNFLYVLWRLTCNTNHSLQQEHGGRVVRQCERPIVGETLCRCNVVRLEFELSHGPFMG